VKSRICLAISTCEAAIVKRELLRLNISMDPCFTFTTNDKKWHMLWLGDANL